MSQKTGLEINIKVTHAGVESNAVMRIMYLAQLVQKLINFGDRILHCYAGFYNYDVVETTLVLFSACD